MYGSKYSWAKQTYYVLACTSRSVSEFGKCNVVAWNFSNMLTQQEAYADTGV